LKIYELSIWAKCKDMLLQEVCRFILREKMPTWKYLKTESFKCEKIKEKIKSNAYMAPWINFCKVHELYVWRFEWLLMFISDILKYRCRYLWSVRSNKYHTRSWLYPELSCHVRNGTQNYIKKIILSLKLSR
jgi:hypothetical protein